MGTSKSCATDIAQDQKIDEDFDRFIIEIHNRKYRYLSSSQEGAASVYTLADGSVGDWFGGFLYSAGQQGNEVVQDQLSALSFTSLAVIFGAGLVTSLSPCTLSVVFYDWPLVILLPSFFNNFDPHAAAANFPSDVQAYLAGLTFALVALPCSTPVLATLLGYIAASKVLLNVY
ncbi:hypothetical protein TEA_027295 [Camellia sinensis var. sinensis]|uniref:Uncharacterized protein n=1 Tax=Camellia sinensis var. sinensis TaxID=542762 RepID=A0A4S4D023_CAMSN|nr:hypothetical protein TEA_027295 [Camellia sinensis var. sinensis]